MRNLLLLLFLVMTLPLAAEKFQGYYVTNSADTIQCTFNISTNMFEKNLLKLSEVGKVLRVAYPEIFQRYDFRPKQIAGFVIFGPQDKTYKFVSMKEDDKFFYHEIISGRISMYKTYDINLYDKSQIDNIILLKEGKLVNVSGFVNVKKRLASLIEDSPEVVAKVEEVGYRKSFWSAIAVEDIVNEYNNYFAE